MKSRLLCLGLLATVSQLFATGCFHPIQRWRANHPCGTCRPCGVCAEKHPLLHPVHTRRAMIGDPVGPVGPVMASPPCHGCSSGMVAPGVPVGFGGNPGTVVPITAPPAGYPPIGYPMPITPGPTVVPSSDVPNPMPVPKSNP
jgi:hypothetical protein